MTYDALSGSFDSPCDSTLTQGPSGTGHPAHLFLQRRAGTWVSLSDLEPGQRPTGASVDAATGALGPARLAGPPAEARASTRSASTDHPEQALLDRLLASDPDAWREFDQRYCRLIERCIRRVTAPFPAVGSEDLREIRATLWLQLLADDKRRLRGFVPGRGSTLTTWIAMLAMHCAYDYLRSLKREPLRVALADAERIGCPQPDPSEQCSARQIAERLTVALQAFSAKDREFVHLYFGKGLGAEQVADRMGISIKTVYTKKHKIRQRLESMMAEARLAA